MISSQAYVFETPLIEGVVIKRNSQFTMTIEAEGQNAKAHCPTTTRIGDIDIAGRPCLLSKSKDPNRKTLYTVEAISLNRPEDNEKAIFLTCFIYDNPGFQVITRSTNYEEVKETVEANVAKGVQTWQANFKITPAEVTLEKYFQLAL